MTDETKGGAPADAGAAAAKDQVPAGTPKGADPEDAVREAARTQQRETKVSFDHFTNPEDRKVAEALAAKAVNEQRASALKEGKIFTAEMHEASLREFAASMKAEAEATRLYYEHLADLGLKKGTEDYTKFVAEANSGFYDKTKFGDSKLIERIARNAQVGQFKPKPDLTASGTAFLANKGTGELRVDKDGITQVAADPILAGAQARLDRMARQARQ